MYFFSDKAMESPFTTTMNEADSEIGAFQIIMDNLNIQQKTRHKTLETGSQGTKYIILFTLLLFSIGLQMI